MALPDFCGRLKPADWSNPFSPTLLASGREEAELLEARASIVPCKLTSVYCVYCRPARVMRFEIWPATSPRRSDGCCPACLEIQLKEIG